MDNLHTLGIHSTGISSTKNMVQYLYLPQPSVCDCVNTVGSILSAFTALLVANEGTMNCPSVSFFVYVLIKFFSNL
jgi:hypothetical protein